MVEKNDTEWMKKIKDPVDRKKMEDEWTSIKADIDRRKTEVARILGLLKGATINDITTNETKLPEHDREHLLEEIVLHTNKGTFKLYGSGSDPYEASDIDLEEVMGHVCDECGGTDAKYIADPFDEVIGGKIIMKWLCKKCYREVVDTT